MAHFWKEIFLSNLFLFSHCSIKWFEIKAVIEILVKFAAAAEHEKKLRFKASTSIDDGGFLSGNISSWNESVVAHKCKIEPKNTIPRSYGGRPCPGNVKIWFQWKVLYKHFRRNFVASVLKLFLLKFLHKF